MINFKKHKIFSGALQFTIFISVIIALLLAAVIILFYTHNFFLQQSQSHNQLISLQNAGFNFLKKQSKLSPDTLSIKLLESDKNYNVKVHLSQWGIYEKACVKTAHRKKEYTKVAFLGSSNQDRPALYLQDNFKPLAVVGKTKIDGNVFLPEQGIKTGNIAGHGYYNNKLVYGNVNQSNNKLPDLLHEYSKHLSGYFLFTPLNNDYIDISQKEVINSFTGSTKAIVSSHDITLQNVSYTGNIIIRSVTKITVRKTAKLTDVILVAPVIEFDDGFSGNVQAIASEAVTLGKDCKLNYPSAIVLNQSGNSLPFNYKNKIHISENCNFKGTLCFFSDSADNNFMPNIYISKSSVIKGEVMCEGNLEMRGEVKGSIYTKYFVTNETGSIYVNHLYNAEVSPKELPANFSGILFKNQTKGIAKWLY
ncbi:hypothetical protein KJK34_07190 [Flavobacterium sp. D11R37]|uniref:hypothetical protein n=1 Tax=Flavobacterium coralii TaxID=2838017 RepID=UPI001CA60C00|nr:hypothetical protein [Flavobacterium coralii]MBY8962534.1 hypothetical protein [Flavobacterium coralii]